MPTYEYQCTKCSERSEAVQSFTDKALVKCSSCGGKLKKLFGSVGVVFKGSGFYRTDSRPAASTSSGGSSGGSSGDSSGNGASPSKEPSSSGSSTDSKPTSPDKGSSTDKAPSAAKPEAKTA